MTLHETDTSHMVCNVCMYDDLCSPTRDDCDLCFREKRQKIVRSVLYSYNGIVGMYSRRTRTICSDTTDNIMHVIVTK